MLVHVVNSALLTEAQQSVSSVLWLCVRVKIHKLSKMSVGETSHAKKKCGLSLGLVYIIDGLMHAT